MSIQNPVTKEMLGEFDNGPDSGWLYTVNNIYPILGLEQYVLEDGDAIIWNYTDSFHQQEKELAVILAGDLLVDGKVTVVQGASQEDKTKAVQAYVAVSYTHL